MKHKDLVSESVRRSVDIDCQEGKAAKAKHNEARYYLTAETLRLDTRRVKVRIEWSQVPPNGKENHRKRKSVLFRR